MRIGLYSWEEENPSTPQKRKKSKQSISDKSQAALIPSQGLLMMLLPLASKFYLIIKRKSSSVTLHHWPFPNRVRSIKIPFLKSSKHRLFEENEPHHKNKIYSFIEINPLWVLIEDNRPLLACACTCVLSRKVMSP